MLYCYSINISLINQMRLIKEIACILLVKLGLLALLYYCFFHHQPVIDVGRVYFGSA